MHLLKKKKEKKMGRKMNENVSLRPFEKEDIPLKVKWINDMIIMNSCIMICL